MATQVNPVVEAPKTETVASQEVAVPETTAVSKDMNQKAQEALDTEQVVVFKLANEEYAAPILDVQEIITTGDITPFPNVPEYIAGIINVRGTVATIINLAKKFTLARKEGESVDRYIILTNTGKSLFGIMVDEVTSVMKIPKANIKEATRLSDNKIHNEYVNGVAVIDERVILILNFQKILDEEAFQGMLDPNQLAQAVDQKAGQAAK
jgi:purine-binding chemotaxis protein CheW